MLVHVLYSMFFLSVEATVSRITMRKRALLKLVWTSSLPASVVC